MSDKRAAALAKGLPFDAPNPGEKLVVHSFAVDGSGRYSWHYAPLNDKQIRLNALNPGITRCIELRVKNFDVSQLGAVVHALPDHTAGIGLWLVVELDENFAASTDRAIEFSRTVGIPESREYLRGVEIVRPRGSVPITYDRRASLMRTCLLSAVSFEYDDRKVNGQRVLQFWDDIADVRMGDWDQAEKERFIHIRWAIIARVERKTPHVPKQVWWVLNAAALVAVAAGLLSVT